METLVQKLDERVLVHLVYGPDVVHHVRGELRLGQIVVVIPRLGIVILKRVF